MHLSHLSLKFSKLDIDFLLQTDQNAVKRQKTEISNVLRLHKQGWANFLVQRLHFQNDVSQK